MAFRRMRRRTFRRRTKWETDTQLGCREFADLYGTFPCSDPLIQARMLAATTMPTADPLDPTTALGVRGTRKVSVAGIKFQSEFFCNPLEWQSLAQCDPAPADLVTIAHVWEAIVVLPLAAGSKTLPAYLPILTGTQQQVDLADRALWKRITSIRMAGSNAAPLIGLQDVSDYFEGHGPVVVKSRVTLDDRHGLFYVKNYVHDLIIDPNPACTMIVQNNFWFKTFYKMRF